MQGRRAGEDGDIAILITCEIHWPTGLATRLGDDSTCLLNNQGACGDIPKLTLKGVGGVGETGGNPDQVQAEGALVAEEVAIHPASDGGWNRAVSEGRDH